MLEHKPHSIFESARAVLSGQSIKESTNLKEAYQPSRYYRAVEENLERLLVLFNPNGQLAKELEREADNVSSEFSKMKEHIEEALEIWETEVEYTVAMSNAAEDEMIDDIDPSDFDESTFEDEEQKYNNILK